MQLSALLVAAWARVAYCLKTFQPPRHHAEVEISGWREAFNLAICTALAELPVDRFLAKPKTTLWRTGRDGLRGTRLGASYLTSLPLMRSQGNALAHLYCQAHRKCKPEKGRVGSVPEGQRRLICIRESTKRDAGQDGTDDKSNVVAIQ